MTRMFMQTVSPGLFDALSDHDHPADKVWEVPFARKYLAEGAILYLSEAVVSDGIVHTGKTTGRTVKRRVAKVIRVEGADMWGELGTTTLTLDPERVTRGNKLMMEYNDPHEEDDKPRETTHLLVMGPDGVVHMLFPSADDSLILSPVPPHLDLDEGTFSAWHIEDVIRELKARPPLEHYILDDNEDLVTDEQRENLRRFANANTGVPSVDLFGRKYGVDPKFGTLPETSLFGGQVRKMPDGDGT